jgi:hypothetical protein
MLTYSINVMSTDSASTERQHGNNTPFLELVIHNQCSNIELVSPLYYSDGTECHLSPDQRVYAGSTMQTYLMVDLFQNEFICALMYRLKGKDTDELNVVTCTQLAMVWKFDKFKRFHLVTRLIEHDKGQVWDKDRMMKLVKHYRLFNMQHGLIEETWLMRDNTVLMIRENVTRKEDCYRLEITIAETSVKDDTWRPWYFDLDK